MKEAAPINVCESTSEKELQVELRILDCVCGGRGLDFRKASCILINLTLKPCSCPALLGMDARLNFAIFCSSCASLLPTHHIRPPPLFPRRSHGHGCHKGGAAAQPHIPTSTTARPAASISRPAAAAAATAATWCIYRCQLLVTAGRLRCCARRLGCAGCDEQCPVLPALPPAATSACGAAAPWAALH